MKKEAIKKEERPKDVVEKSKESQKKVQKPMELFKNLIPDDLDNNIGTRPEPEKDDAEQQQIPEAKAKQGRQGRQSKGAAAAATSILEETPHFGESTTEAKEVPKKNYQIIQDDLSLSSSDLSFGVNEAD